MTMIQLNAKKVPAMKEAQRNYRRVFKWHPSFVKYEKTDTFGRKLGEAFMMPGFCKRRYSSFHGCYLYQTRNLSPLAKLGNQAIGVVGTVLWASFYGVLFWQTMELIVTISESYK